MEPALGLDLTSGLASTLARLQEEHRVLLDSLPDALVMVLDVDLRYVQVSRSMESLGWAAEDVLGKTIDEVLAARPDVCARYRAALAGESQSFDYTSLNGERTFWLQIEPLRDGMRFSEQ